MVPLRFGLTLSMYPPKDLVELGVLAEKNGFDSVWVPDHFVDLPPSGDKVEPWVVLASIGALTHRIMLSSGVTDVQRCHPAKTAHVVATLDELSGGRAAVGIGAGEAMNIVPYGIPWESAGVRRERLREAVILFKRLWNSNSAKTVTLAGRFYSLNKAWLDQHPVQQPHPPVYIGVLASPKMLEVVGELGEGWFPWLNSPETFIKRREIITKSARSHGRNPDELDLAIVLFTAVTDNPELEKTSIDALKAEILMLVDRETLGALGYSVPHLGFEHKLIYEQELAAKEVVDVLSKNAQSMPDSVARKFMATGRVEDCIKSIEAFIRAGCTHVTLRDVLGQYVKGDANATARTVEIFGREIIPYFKDEYSLKR